MTETIERLKEKYGKPSTWYDGGAWHYLWIAAGFSLVIRDGGGVSMDLFSVTPEQVESILWLWVPRPEVAS